MFFCYFLIFLLFLPGSSRPVTKNEQETQQESKNLETSPVPNDQVERVRSNSEGSTSNILNLDEPPTKKFKSSADVSDSQLSDYPVCYFDQVRSDVHETKPRLTAFEVSENCSEVLIPFTRLINNHEQQVTQFGAANEADLVLARGAGEFVFSWEDETVVDAISQRFICQKHREELSSSKDDSGKHRHLQRKQRACTFPLERGHKSFQVAPHDLQHAEAKAILFVTGTLIYEGTFLCSIHKKYVREQVFNKLNEQMTSTTEEPHNDDETPRSSSRCKKINYLESPDRLKKNKVEPTTPARLRHYSNRRSNIPENEAGCSYVAFMKALNINPMSSHSSWNVMTVRNKYRHIAAFKSTVEKIAEFAVGKSDAPILMQAANVLSESETTGNGQDSEAMFLTEISKFYYTAGTSSERQYYLAQVADIYPISILEKYFPGLTPWKYYEAKKTAKRIKGRQDPFVVSGPKPRVKLADLDSFIGFLCSESITTGLPFGKSTTVLPNGQKVEVPSAIRSFRASQIILMYRNDMRNRGLTCQLSESTMRRILEACPAKTKVALDAVDQFKANGLKAFQWMSALTDSLLTLNICDVPTAKLYKALLTEAEFFLKADYYNLLQAEHQAADLCWNYALSDSNIKAFRSEKCRDRLGHRYLMQRAYTFDNLCANIKSDIDDYETDNPGQNQMQLRQLRTTIEESDTAVSNWRNHVVRKRYSDKTRTDIFNNLRNGDALITIDYAQKWLPRKCIEPQQDYFGKAGLSMHVMHAVFKRCNEIQHHTVVHFLGYAEQDYVTVTAILISGLKVLAANGVRSVTLRSDNAGYYHNAAFLMSMPLIGQKAGVNLKRYSFSEAQAGKSTADVETARLKNVLRAYVNSGNDILTEHDMFNAINEAINATALHGVTAIVPTKIPVYKKMKKTLNQMYFIGDVEYYKENGKFYMKYWKHYKIGDGIKKVLTSEDIIGLPITPFEDETFSMPVIPFWRAANMNMKPPMLSDVVCDDDNSTDTSNVYDGDIDNETFDSCSSEGDTDALIANLEDQMSSCQISKESGKHEGLYRCEFEGCTREFLTPHGLERHRINGTHKLVVEKETLRETCYNLYVDTMTGLRDSRQAFISATTNSRDVEVQSDADIKPEGWALKKAASRARFSETVKDFLKEHYVSQILLGRKRVDPNTVQNLMRESESPFFSAKDRLSAAQIASWYSRSSKELKKLLKNAQSSIPTEDQFDQAAIIALEAMDEEAGYDDQYRDDPSFPEEVEQIHDSLTSENRLIDVDNECI